MRKSALTFKHLAWFLGTVIVGGVFSLWILGFNNQLPTFGSTYKLRAVVPTASALIPNSRVTMAGVDVGKVTRIERRGTGAVVHLEIRDDRVTPVPRDSRVLIRSRTPLGENYVSITPGSSDDALKPDSLVPVSQSGEYVDVDQILSTFAGRTRDSTRDLIQSVGTALDGHEEDLNRLLSGGADTVTYGSRALALVVQDKEAVSRLVDQVGSLTAAIGERDAAIAQIGRDGVTTFRAIADRDAALRSTLRTLPSALGQLRKTMGTLESVTGRAAPVIDNVAAALSDLQPTVQALGPASRSGGALLDELRDAAPGLTDTLRGVRRLSGPGASALPQLGRTLCQVNPMLRYAEPYKDDVIQLIIGLGSAANSYDAIGHTLRLAPTINDNSLVGSIPSEFNQAAGVLLHSGFLSKGSGLQWIPYPKPGQIGSSTASGKPLTLGPKDIPATGYKYPRIHAAC
jgi:ABC-type transporter Mla subunit MlaD